MPFKKCISTSIMLVSMIAALACAAQNSDLSTPYDLIRPVWPLTWDPDAFDNFDTTVTIKHNMVPKNRTPASFIPNAFIPDTLNQAFLDNINTHISPIRVNQAGYLTKDPERKFYYVGSATSFEIVDAEGNSLSPSVTGAFSGTGPSISSSWTIVAGTNAATADQQRYKVTANGPSGEIQIGNIPPNVPTDTRLRVKVGKDVSSTFIVSDRVYSMVKNAALKFYGINRSGNSESWFHPASHTMDGAGGVVVNPDEDIARGVFHPEMAGTLEGGYYDCGDHLKESLTQMYAFMVAAVMAATNPNADDDVYAFNQSETVNTDGIPDMLREARHGAEFVLRSYVRAKGVIDDMALSVGIKGSDHGWWGRPENQDKLPTDVSKGDPAVARGGPASRAVRLGELGATASGLAVAGLAILGKDYAQYDKPFADSCLMVAKEMYEFAKSMVQGKSTYGNGKPFKNNKPLFNSAAYQGNNEFVDEMALACTALWYATEDPKYGDEAIRTRDMYGAYSSEKVQVQGPQYMDGAGAFAGGWFVTDNKGFLKNTKNTSWANNYSYALYALYKLILQDKDKAISVYGLSEKEWLDAVEDCVTDMILNLGDMGNSGSASIVLPSIPGGQGPAWKPTTIMYDPIWYTMHTDLQWIYNRYLAGNIFEVLAYADVANDITKKNLALPIMGTPDWKADEMQQLGINQLNYLLGVNPWDVSYIMGVGDKNDAHPHHRASNPEGKNMPGASYKYKPPVGALFGSIPPGTTNDNAPSTMSWEDYEKSEVCIDAAATLIGVSSLASQQIDRTRAPSVSVEIRHVSMDSAIVMVKLSTRGTATIYYGTNEGNMATAATTDDGKAGVQHEIVLRGLQNGTTYYFYALGQNAYVPENKTLKYMVDSTQTPFSFTTLSTVESAEIANVTVCNLAGDSAEIMWYTPNGEYESKIYWDTIPHANASEYAFNSGNVNADVAGIPTKFHYVKIGGLKEQTTYYYVVESNGVQQNVDDNGNRLKFTTPVGWYDFSVRAYQYEFTGMDFLNLNIYNNEARSFDSLELRMYFTALPEEVERCGMLIDVDIPQAYDEAGFNHPLLDKDGNDVQTAVRELMRKSLPIRLDDTYDATTGKYSYYFPVPLGSTEMKSSSRIRLDFGFSSGLSNDNYKTCETLRTAAKKRFSKTSGDWSWSPHEFLVDGADYDGMPVEDKEYGDKDNEIAINQFITVYRKNEFIWGYSPSRSEMVTKRAHYTIETTLDAPFNVSNGSYVELDQTSSTVYVSGHAFISEQGYITKIWANGTQIKATTQRVGNEIFMVDENRVVIAHYNISSGNGPIDSTGLWTLNIPVKMKIGSNKVDITIFAGPDPECQECTENGGCAFENRSYYVQFTRGNLTASNMTINDETGAAVKSPADPSGTRFYINLTDQDKKNYKGNLTVNVINSKKGDTLKVVMVEDAASPGTFKSPLITAVSVDKNNKTGNQISFYPGDVIQVVYTDPDDEEDVSTQSFFAEAKYPEPQNAWAMDSDCDNIADQIYVTFTNALSEEYRFDSIRVFLPGMKDTVTVAVNKEDYLDKSEVTIALPQNLGIEENAAPSGAATVYLFAEGAVQPTSIKIHDGIAPQLLSVTLLENPVPRAEQDTLMVAFTEPVNLSSETVWPIEVNSAATAIISVVGRATTSNDGKSWMFVVTGNTDGEYLKQGNTVSVKSGIVTDKNLNELVPSCKTIAIVETPKPVPVELAEMRDPDGDGVPSELYLRFEKKLRTKDMLDSFVVRWGLDTLITSFITESDTSTGEIVPKGNWTITNLDTTFTVSVIDADSSSPSFGLEIPHDTTKSISIITINIPSGTYPYGTTTGPDEGKGKVVPRLGPEGGFFDKSYIVNDKCPPVIVTATWKGYDLGDNELGSRDNVTLTLSEPVDTIAGHPYVVERSRDGVKGVFFNPAQNPNLSVSYTARTVNQQLEYRHKDVNALWIGDSIRLISDETTGYFVDRAGLYPGYATPWVPITGSVSNVKFTITSVEPVTNSRNNYEIYYGGTPFNQNERFRLTARNKAGETVILASGDNELSRLNVANKGPFPNYKSAGPVFEIEAALPFGSSREYNINIGLDVFSNLGAYVINTHYSDSTKYMKEFISAGGTITFYLEWCAPEDFPASASGKKIGTGPYIAKFKTGASSTEFPAVRETGDQTQEIKDSDTFTRTFGFKRIKNK